MKAATMYEGTPTGSTFDVIVIGGGLAGLAAADRLRNESTSVLVLEGSERLGGRTFGRYWEPAGREIDLGGTWLLPSFTVATDLIKDLRLKTRLSPEARLWMTHFSTGIREERVLPRQDAADLLQATGLLVANYQDQEAAVSAVDLLSRVRMSRRSSDWHHATHRFLAGAPMAEVDAGHLFLDEEDLLNPEHYSLQIEGTTQKLVDALSKRSGAHIKANSRVEQVEHDGMMWLVTTGQSRQYRAMHVVVALPRNTLASVSFRPSPSGALAELIARPHTGASRKDWFVLDNADTHFRVFASEGPFGYFRSEAELPDGGMLAVALAPQVEGLIDPPDFEHLLQPYLPGVRVRSHMRHDWVADPFAKGTWLAPRPGDYARNSSARSPHPHLYFVGSDFSVDFPGTIEGALRTGISAAERIAGL